jgi:hypothetical protein
MTRLTGIVCSRVFARACVGLLTVACLARPAAAQKGRPLTVTGTQALTFNTVFPGISATVSRTDALLSGQFQVTGAKSTAVRVTFTLPAGLMVGGQMLPMSFGANDGGVSTSGTIGTATAFDPRVPLTATTSNNGRLYLYLGGTVSPPGQQGAGNYTGTVTISVCYVGTPPC